MKKVLMIAYYFPPIGGSGMQRTVKFVKHLYSLGWSSVILTVTRKEHYEFYDNSLTRDIPSATRIYKTACFNPYGIFNIPDHKIAWIATAALKGLKICKQEDINVIYSTSPPVTAHIIGYLIKKITHLPWVADFRDPLVKNCVSYKNWFRAKIALTLERLIVYKADKIITNTDFAKRDFQKRYPIVEADRFCTITNGYDEKDFINRDISFNNRKNNKFMISHTGEFYEKVRIPDNFLKAVNLLIREEKIPKNEVIINFVGGGEYTKSAEYTKLIGDLDLIGIVKSIDHVSHEKSITYLFESHVLLLLAAYNGPLQVPAKVYEYIRAGVPIIALAKEGATSELIKTMNAGIVAHPNDINEIKGTIYRLYMEYKESISRVKIDLAVSEKFDRKFLTQNLVNIFESFI
jgi:glycosyltransferase involved in cell wall biosynthesis